MKKLIAFFDALAIILVSFYYLKLCGLSWGDFFSVAPQVYILAACFLFLFAGGAFLRSAIIPPALYFAAFGFFLYPWKGIDIAFQVIHILLFINVLYLILKTLLRLQIFGLAFGLVFGVLLTIGGRIYQISVLDRKPSLARNYLPRSFHPLPAKKTTSAAGKALIKKASKLKR